MTLPTSSIRFQGSTLIQPRIAGSPPPDGMGPSFWDRHLTTISFWLKIHAYPTANWFAPVSVDHYGGLMAKVGSNGRIGFVATCAPSVLTGPATAIETPTTPILPGTWSHWLVTFDGSASGVPATLTVRRNGEPLFASAADQNGPSVLNVNAGRAYLTIGNSYPPAPGLIAADCELADVAVWIDYAGTAQDAADLVDQVKRPPEIAAAYLAAYFTGDGGTIGANVMATDAGVTNQGNDPTFATTNGLTYSFEGGSLTGPSVNGSLTYSGPEAYTPPVETRPYLPESGQGIGFLFVPASGVPGRAHLTGGRTRSNLIAFGRHPTITIHRAGGGSDVVTLDPDYAYFSNSTTGYDNGLSGQDWIYYDLLGQGVTAIGPTDTVTVECAHHWVEFTEGYCLEYSGSVPRSSPLPTLPTGLRTLRAGYNLRQPTSFNLPYYGNWFRWTDNCFGYNPNGTPNWGMARDANALPRPGLEAAGSYAEGLLLNMDGVPGYDLAATRGPKDGNDGEQYVSPYYDNATYGTAGFKLGYGLRPIPRKGKIHVVWDYVAGHEGDGVVKICLGQNGDDANGDITGGEPSGPQVYSWTFNPPIQAGTGGVNTYRTYEYTCNDPHNGLGGHGARLAPHLRVRWTGWATNIRITVEADASLPEAAWNVDRLNPPLFHPYLIDEVLRDVDTVRIMDWANPIGSGLSGADQYTAYDHFTWGLPYSNLVTDQGVPTRVGIVSVTPYTEPDATTLRNTYGGANYGGCPVRIALDGEHKLRHGAAVGIDWNGATLEGTKDGTMAPRAVHPASQWLRIARPLSTTDLLVWLPLVPDSGSNPDTEPGILSRVYTSVDLPGAAIVQTRQRTLPLRAIGELATAAGVNVHFNLSYGIALDTTETTAVADTIAAHFPANRDFYLELGNEIWNLGGIFALSLEGVGDDLGLVDGAHPSQPMEYAHHVDITSRVAKLFRQRWAAAGLDPSRVKASINTGPGGWIGYAGPRIVAANSTGDPLDRIDEISCNTYWNNLGAFLDTGDDPDGFPGRENLTAGQNLDILELVMARGFGCFQAAANQRTYLDNAGLSDVKLSSYEGGSEIITVGPVASQIFNAADLGTVVDAGRVFRTQTEMFRSPRWGRIRLASLQRMETAGIVRYTQYVSSDVPWVSSSNVNRARSVQPMYWWTSYLSMELAGKGDGSDGLWDNRVTPGRPYAAYVEGDSVSTDAYAIKTWNAMAGPGPDPPDVASPINDFMAFYLYCLFQ